MTVLPAAGQHMACNPGDWFKNSCPAMDTPAAPGATVVVPVFKFCPKPNTLWMTVNCQPPGTCTTIRHSRVMRTIYIIDIFGGLNGADEDDAERTDLYTAEYYYDDVISQLTNLDDRESAPYLYTATMTSGLEPKVKRSFESTNAHMTFQMLENTSGENAELAGQVDFVEDLELGHGRADRDRFMNISNADLRLENSGDVPATLEVWVIRKPRVNALDGDIPIAPGYALAAGATHRAPGPDSFVPVDAGPTPLADLIGDSAPSFVMTLEPGESWEKRLAGWHAGRLQSGAGLLDLEDDLELVVRNTSDTPVSLTKTLTAERSGVLAPGERRYWLCVGGGDIYDDIESTQALNAVTVKQVEGDIQPGETDEIETMGFDHVNIEVLAFSIRKIKINDWCWSETPVDTYTIHYIAGATATIDSKVTVPPTAMSGDVITRWYTINAQAGTMMVNNAMCHFNVVVP